MRQFWQNLWRVLKKSWHFHWLQPIGDGALHSFGMPVPILAICTELFELFRRAITGIPRNCSSRIELYRLGARMLKSPRRQVTAVSTITDEEFPSKPVASVANHHIRGYFVALHRIAYANRLGGRTVKLLRYADITDTDKCQEALSLLYFGSNVEIRPSKVPVEFVTADDRSTLIGFPSGTELFGGFHSFNPQQCKAMAGWIEAHGAAGDPSGERSLTSPVALVNELRRLREPDHAAGCLCGVVDTVGDTNPADRCANEYDVISKWYAGLYHHVDREDYYGNLSRRLRDFLPEDSKTSTFVDIGCGQAFGADVLVKHDFRYFGLDVAKGMVDRAPTNSGISVYQCDAIGALMGVDARGKNFYTEAPAKFDVIACQGNSFDFFLGSVQKALALFLFDKRLHENGLLMFTGHRFEQGVNKYHRTLPYPLQEAMLDVEYDLNWIGDYCNMNIKAAGPTGLGLLLHPVSQAWLKAFLDKMGYVEVRIGLEWYGPSGDVPYYLWAFRRKDAKPDFGA